MIIEIARSGDGFNLELTPENEGEETILRAAKIQTGHGVKINLNWWGDTELRDPKTGELLCTTGLKINFSKNVEF